MKTILYTWFAVLLFGMAAVSCGDDDTKNNDTTGITGSSWKASETVGADRTTKKYTFKASANWVAQSDKPEWCKILTSSGDKGSDRQLNITVEANETGSTRSANITVQVSGYARAAQFAITLHTVEQKQTVPLDDAFAGTLGFDSVDALKESIREKKRRSHEANADRIAGAALLDMAGANLTAELNGAILDQNAERDMNALRDRLRRSKMTMELYCKAGQTTPDGVRAAFRRDAERKMRSILAVRAIAEAEQITVSNAEVDAEYARLAKLHDTPEPEIRKVLSRDAVASAVTTQKVQRFLIEHANITSVVEGE